MIKLAQIIQGQHQVWLFRIRAYEHQQPYDSEREAIEAAKRLLFTLFRDIDEDHQRAALRRGGISLAIRLSERRGYWQGRREEKKLHQLALGNALAALRYLT